MKNSEMLSYFGLCESPFSKELPTEHLQMLPSVQRNLASARLLVDTRGVGVISGKAGTGKTSLLRLLFDSLPPGLFKSFYLCHSSVGLLEFYTHLCTLFGLEPCSRRAAMFRELQNHILTLATVSHVHPVLALDEAHLLSNDILAEIRLLTEFPPGFPERPHRHPVRQRDPHAQVRSLDAGVTGHLHHRHRFGGQPLSRGECRLHRIAHQRLRPEGTSVHQERHDAHPPSFGGHPAHYRNYRQRFAAEGVPCRHKQVEAEHVQSVIQR